MSLGRHPPPNPRPASRNWRPIRTSWPSASASTVTSAPAASQTAEIALMNEIFVARNAFALTLTSSAVGRSHDHHRACPRRSARRRPGAATPPRVASVPPMTMRSGCSVSSTALPSRRNSGFQTSSTCTPCGRLAPATSVRSRAPVPTGTVDLPTIRPSWRQVAARSRSWPPRRRPGSRHGSSWTAGCRRRRSAHPPSPTASATSVVNRSRPVASCSAKQLGQSGLVERAPCPAESISTLCGSVSTPTTSMPSWAMATAWVAPR